MQRSAGLRSGRWRLANLDEVLSGLGSAEVLSRLFWILNWFLPPAPEFTLSKSFFAQVPFKKLFLPFLNPYQLFFGSLLAEVELMTCKTVKKNKWYWGTWSHGFQISSFWFGRWRIWFSKSEWSEFRNMGWWKWSWIYWWSTRKYGVRVGNKPCKPSKQNAQSYIFKEITHQCAWRKRLYTTNSNVNWSYHYV